MLKTYIKLFLCGCALISNLHANELSLEGFPFDSQQIGTVYKAIYKNTVTYSASLKCDNSPYCCCPKDRLECSYDSTTRKLFCYLIKKNQTKLTISKKFFDHLQNAFVRQPM